MLQEQFWVQVHYLKQVKNFASTLHAFVMSRLAVCSFLLSASWGLVEFRNGPEEVVTFFFRVEFKIVAAGSPETLGSFYKTARCHTPSR